MGQKRLDYLDMVKGVGIILVVIGHSGYVSDHMLTWLVSFHMPLFFIVSGILFAYKESEKTTFFPYLKRRFCGMMLPYFWFSLINIGIDSVRMHLHPETVGRELIHTEIRQTLSLFGISVLWFLPTIFLGELCLYAVVKHYSSWIRCIIGVVTAVLSAVGGYLSGTDAVTQESWTAYFLTALLRVGSALTLLLLGHAIYFGLQKLSVKAVWEWALAAGCLVINIAAAYWNGRVDLHYLVFQNVMLYYLGACSGTLGMILICKRISPLWLLTFLGKNSLIVMLTHLDCRVINFAIRFADVTPMGGAVFFRIKLYLTLLIGELLLIVLINRFGFFLIGGKRPVKMEAPGCLLIKRNKNG